MTPAPPQIEAEARRLLATVAFKDGCHENTQDAILREPLDYLEMVKVKASVALRAIIALSPQPTSQDDADNV